MAKISKGKILPLEFLSSNAVTLVSCFNCQIETADWHFFYDIVGLISWDFARNELEFEA